jgi:predicted extracellular nuclease
LRAGDTIAGLTGALGYAFGAYEIHPVESVSFDRVNHRDPAPADVGGSLTVASFNVLNYFTTIDTGPDICGPSGDMDCRGADSADEFTRQRAKIISALSTLDADIVGLMEIENNATAAIQDLVDGLNAVMGAGTYAFIDTGAIGTDAIKVALIYKPASVTPAGDYAILDSTVDDRFIDTRNRPVLAQTFEQVTDGARLTVAVNHLKSKGSPCDDIGDPDVGDGQGNCNLTRTSAAEALVDWLAPDGSDDPDVLIIGDLNAYAMEDPITAIKSAGYTDLIQAELGADAYSYVFYGQAGYLDHALANASLTDQVTGVTEWHINADEPSALNYNNYNQPALYSPDPYRASDHDPVVVGLDLNAPPDCSAAAPSIDTIWPPNHKFVTVNIVGVTDPEGDPFTLTVDGIYQDEPVDSTGDGNFAPDGEGIGTSVAQVRAERDGSGNGRVYHVYFSASNEQGTCSGELLVSVPQSKKQVAVDDGPRYDSTVQ